MPRDAVSRTANVERMKFFWNILREKKFVPSPYLPPGLRPWTPHAFGLRTLVGTDAMAFNSISVINLTRFKKKMSQHFFQFFFPFKFFFRHKIV